MNLKRSCVAPTRADGVTRTLSASHSAELDDECQLGGTCKGGTVVLGTVTGPPPPRGFAEPDDFETGLAGPCVSWSRTSRVPEFAVVTKPPMLGLAMFHSENAMGMSASTSMSDPTRSAVTGKLTDLV